MLNAISFKGQNFGVQKLSSAQNQSSSLKMQGPLKADTVSFGTKLPNVSSDAVKKVASNLSEESVQKFSKAIDMINDGRFGEYAKKEVSNLLHHIADNKKLCKQLDGAIKNTKDFQQGILINNISYEFNDPLLRNKSNDIKDACISGAIEKYARSFAKR